MASSGLVLWRGPHRVLVASDGALWWLPYLRGGKLRPRLLRPCVVRHLGGGSAAWFAPKPPRV